MAGRCLPSGSFVRIEKPQLQALVDALQAAGYRTVGPRVQDGAVVYDELESVRQLPIGMIDVQDGGTYRIEPDGRGAWFDYVVGPHSLKNFLFPPRETLVEIDLRGSEWSIREPVADQPPLAVIGPRSCDLHALRIQDRVFLDGPYVDPAYRARREQLFLVAVNCRRAAATCFCHSMKTGPAVTAGFDLALTELEQVFLVQIGTERGGEVMAAVPWTPCTVAEMDAARAIPQRLAQQMQQRSHASAGSADGGPPAGRCLDTNGLRDLLLANLDNPRWQEVANRCLACANCTMVCPTCFCSSVQEVSDLTGEQVRRERSWASCFTAEHSYMNSGTVRKSTAARYRQWLTHKLATWHDQFDSSGCVGCGRCITWCPVGIDLTEEVRAIRETA